MDTEMQENSHGKMEAEIGVMLSQGKKCQRLISSNHQKLEDAREVSFLETLEGVSPC